MARKAKRNRTKGSGSLYLRGSTWWMAYSGPQGTFRDSTGKTTKGEAQAVLTNKIAALNSGRITAGSQKTTVTDLYALVVRDYEQNGKKTLDDVKTRWKLHLDPAFGKHRAAAVTSGMIEQYKAARLAEVDRPTNGTVNRELTLLRRAFNIGEEQGKVTRIPKFSLLKESKPRDGFLEQDQYNRMAEACSKATDAPWLRAFFETAAQLSNRRSELLNLRVHNVDFARNVFTLPDSKNGERRIVPLTPEVRALLESACLNKQADDYVFTQPNGKRVSEFRYVWKRVTTAAGVPWLKVHDMRRTGIRNMIRGGVSEQVAMRISGHKTASVFRRYNIIDDRDLHNAARLISEGRTSAGNVQIMHNAENLGKGKEKTTIN